MEPRLIKLQGLEKAYGMNRSDMEKWFADLGAPNFSSDAAFDTENGLQVEFVLSEDNQELLITIILGLLSVRTDPDVYRMILHANYLGIETSGGCLSLAEDDETLLLWRVAAVSAMDADALTNTVSGLLDAAAAFKDHLFDESLEAEVRRGAASPPPLSMA